MPAFSLTTDGSRLLCIPQELPSPYVPEIAHVTDTSNIDFEDDSDDDDDDLDLRHACSEARKTLAGFVTVADNALTQLSVDLA